MAEETQSNQYSHIDTFEQIDTIKFNEQIQSLEGSAIKGIDSMDSSFDLSSSISDELEVWLSSLGSSDVDFISSLTMFSSILIPNSIISL